MSRAFVTALAGTALLGIALASGSAAAQSPEHREPTPRISVSGEGEVLVSPDMAIISLTVLREADTARNALNANSAAMKEVIGALKASGIADRDLQTSQFNIQPRYSQPPRDRPSEPKIVGYTVSNRVTVKVRDLSEASSIIDKTVSLGVNQGGNVSFIKDDLKDTMTEARKRAVADAIEKAKTLAEAAGVKLGRVLSISEGGARGRPVSMDAAAPMRMAQAAPSIEAGENAYRTQVNVVFELGQ